MYDLRITGGTVYDSSQHLAGQADVCVQDGRVAAIGPDATGDARETIDATDRLVTPGLVDLHTHIYWGVSHYGITPDDSCLAQGVTTAVDAGSSGAYTFPGLRQYVIEPAQTRLYAFLHVSAVGLFSQQVGESADERLLDIDAAVKVIEENRDVIVGVKVRQSVTLVGSQGLRPLRDAIRVAEQVGVPVMVHIGNLPAPIADLLALLRPGDMVTHCFTERPEALIGPDGHVRTVVREARERGVRFDVGHGSGSFVFEVAERCAADGFLPDTISSDLHVYSRPGPVHYLGHVLSKFLHLGLTLEQAFERATVAPARTVGLPDGVGTLGVGVPADVAIWELRQEPVTFVDCRGDTRQGTQHLLPAGVVRAGRVVTAGS